MKKGFVFDLDGVITDTAKFHYIAWKALAHEIEIEIDLEFNERLKGISRIDSLHSILEYGGKATAYSDSEIAKLAAQKNKVYVELLQSLTASDLLPGVKEFLNQAHEKNIPCVIASASKNAPFILDKLEVTDYFIDIVDPSTLTKGKPDSEIFLRAVELMRITPNEAVGFEDAQAGIDGMNSCGMFTVGVVSDKPLQGADIMTTRLDTLNIDKLLVK